MLNLQKRINKHVCLAGVLWFKNLCKKCTGSRWGGMSYIVRLDWKIVTCAIFLAKGFSNSEIITILALKNWHTCHYIQSALAIPNKEKEEQELQSLVNINDSFKKIVVVNGNIKPWRNEKGILFIGLMDFLLDKTSLEYWIDGLKPAVEHDRQKAASGIAELAGESVGSIGGFQ